MMKNHATPAKSPPQDMIVKDYSKHPANLSSTQSLRIREAMSVRPSTEHSLRLKKNGMLLCVPAIRVHHDVPQDGSVTWKSYYALRNRLDCFRRHFGLRYFYMEYILTQAKLLAKRLLGRSSAHDTLTKRALHDAIHRLSGPVAPYLPGWRLAQQP